MQIDLNTQERKWLAALVVDFEFSKKMNVAETAMAEAFRNQLLKKLQQ